MLLSSASGFYSRRDEHLYLVTNRQVLIDEPGSHRPDRIVIQGFTDPTNLAMTAGFSVPLYQNGEAQWLQAQDTCGTIDVVVIELQCDARTHRGYQPRAGGNACGGRGSFIDGI